MKAYMYVCVLMLVATAVCGVMTRERDTATDNVDIMTTGNVFINAVVTDHKAVRALATRFHGEDRNEDTAKAIVGALLRHDRRERMTLYPLASVLLSDSEVTQMRNEHNTALLVLQQLCTADLTNSTQQHVVDEVLVNVFKHIKEEETTLLPVLAQFLSTRPKLTTALWQKWNSITSTQRPLMTELIDSEHVTIRMLTSALRMYARAVRANPDDTNLVVRRDKIAHTLVKHLHEHSLCETAVFYPLVNKVFGSAATVSMLRDHNMLDELVAKLKVTPVSGLEYIVTLNKAIRLELKHIAAERELIAKMNPYLEQNVDENEDLVTSFVKCEMIHLI